MVPPLRPVLVQEASVMLWTANVPSPIKLPHPEGWPVRAWPSELLGRRWELDGHPWLPFLPSGPLLDAALLLPLQQGTVVPVPAGPSENPKLNYHALLPSLQKEWRHLEDLFVRLYNCLVRSLRHRPAALPENPPHLPSTYGYEKAHHKLSYVKTSRDESRSSFILWMTAISYLMAAHGDPQGSAESQPPWLQVASSQFSRPTLDLWAATAFADFSNYTSRIGVHLDIRNCFWHTDLPFLAKHVPVHIRWGPLPLDRGLLASKAHEGMPDHHEIQRIEADNMRRLASAPPPPVWGRGPAHDSGGWGRSGGTASEGWADRGQSRNGGWGGGRWGDTASLGWGQGGPSAKTGWGEGGWGTSSNTSGDSGWINTPSNWSTASSGWDATIAAGGERRASTAAVGDKYSVTRRKDGETPEMFFARRRERYEQLQDKESEQHRQMRESRRRHQAGYPMPGKKGAKVYVWEENDDGVLQRQACSRNSVLDIWCIYTNSQKRYDDWADEWDLLPLSDADKANLDEDEYDEEDYFNSSLEGPEMQSMPAPASHEQEPSAGLSDTFTEANRPTPLAVDPARDQGMSAGPPLTLSANNSVLTDPDDVTPSPLGNISSDGTGDTWTSVASPAAAAQVTPCENVGLTPPPLRRSVSASISAESSSFLQENDVGTGMDVDAPESVADSAPPLQEAPSGTLGEGYATSTVDPVMVEDAVHGEHPSSSVLADGISRLETDILQSVIDNSTGPEDATALQSGLNNLDAVEYYGYQDLQSTPSAAHVPPAQMTWLTLMGYLHEIDDASVTPHMRPFVTAHIERLLAKDAQLPDLRRPTNMRIFRVPINGGPEEQVKYCLAFPELDHSHGQVFLPLASTAVFALREGWASVEQAVHRLVTLGMSFYIGHVYGKWDSRPPRFHTRPAIGLGWRSKGFKPTRYCYGAYERACQDILNSVTGHTALRCGGIIWRLAVHFRGLDNMIDQVADVDWLPAVLDCLPGGQLMSQNLSSSHTVLSAALCQDDLDIICGTYYVDTGKGSQVLLYSWWPRTATWQTHLSSHWTSKHEAWFQKRLLEIREGLAVPLSTEEWKTWMKRAKRHGKLENSYNELAEAFLASSPVLSLL